MPLVRVGLSLSLVAALGAAFPSGSGTAARISPPPASQQIPLPSRAPEQWLLGFVDVETTGLIPGHHEMIDVGLILTDLDGGERARFFERIQPEHPERLSPEAAAINGFSVAGWERLGARPPREVVAELIAFLDRAAAERRVMLVAYNVAFDAAFLEHLFRGAGEELEEHVFFHQLDLPSMAWALGYRQVLHGALPKALGLESETDDPLRHTGLSGAAFNVALYRRLHEKFPAPR